MHSLRVFGLLLHVRPNSNVSLGTSGPMHQLSRSFALRLASCAALLSFSVLAVAQSDPTKPKDMVKLKELVALCDGDLNAQRECTQFIRGVRSGVFAQRLFSIVALRHRRLEAPIEMQTVLVQPAICVPETESDEAVREKVMLHSKKQPTEQLEASAGSHVLAALAGSYRCAQL